MAERFLWVFTVPDTIFLCKKGFFALQNDNFWKAKKPFLQCNGSPNGVLKWSFSNEKEPFYVT